MGAPGGVGQVCLQDLSLNLSKNETAISKKHYKEHDGQDDHITSKLGTKEGSQLEGHGQTKHFEQVDHVTSTLMETDLSFQHSSKHLPHASQRHFEANTNRGNQDHISS